MRWKALMFVALVGCGHIVGPYGHVPEKTRARNYNHRGLQKAASGNYHAAEANFELAVKHWPSLAEAWRHLGYARLALREYHSALDAYAKAITLDSDSAVAHAGASLACIGTRDLVCARSHLVEAKRLEPKSIEFEQALAYVQMLMDECEDSIVLASKLLAKQPNLPWMHLSRGWCQMGLGEFEDAKQDLTLALSHRDTSYSAGVALAAIHLLLEEHDEAWVRIRKLLHQNTDDVSLHLVAGRLLLVRRDFKAAGKHARKAKSLQPGTEEDMCADAILEHAEAERGNDACPEGKAAPIPEVAVLSISI